MTERFHKTWRGTVVSSEGFSIRLNGRNRLLYKGEAGQLSVATESLRRVL